MFPAKLGAGSGIRIIAPSCTLLTLPWLKDEFLQRAHAFFEERGMQVSEGKHLREEDDFGTTSIAARIEDLHDAFRDPSVHALIAIRGGFASNQLLGHLDYDLIKANPKILCGFSDITALGNAILAKSGLVTYSGPSYYQFALGDQLRYTFDAFERCLMHDEPFTIEPSAQWTSERFSSDHQTLAFQPNDGPWVIQEGEADGRLLGGNLCTFNLLHGTPFMPSMENSILFVEDDYESVAHTFDRNLQSLCHQPEFTGVQGLVIGRFQPASGVTRSLLQQIIHTKDELRGLPVIANADFGHTHPMITFPIGGKTRIEAHGNRSVIRIVEH